MITILKMGETGGNDNHRDEEVLDFDLESFSSESDDSFSSAPSLLANCQVSSSAVSTAVPVLRTYSKNDINEQLETPSSPASEIYSSTSSYETGFSSLIEASFVQCLFPLHPPNSGFLGRVEYQKNGFHSDHESDSNVIAKRTATLGELIMLSRRSYHRKAVQMGNQNLSMELKIGKAFSCCVFDAGIKMLGGLQRKRHHPKLKLRQAIARSCGA